MTDKPLKISVIIPALNEEKNITATVARTLTGLNRWHIDGTVIVVNDGSTDSTPAIVAELAKTEPRIKLVTNASPRGIGGAFWSGMPLADGDFVVMIPGDNETDPWEIFRYAELLNHVDVVIPFVFNKGVRPAWRNLLSGIYTAIINTSFSINLQYTNGTILYRKSLLDTLMHQDNSFFFQTDILIRLIRAGYLFAEVPYRLGVRKGGVTKALSFNSLRKVAGGYLKLAGDFYFSAAKPVEYTPDSQTHARRRTDA